MALFISKLLILGYYYLTGHFNTLDAKLVMALRIQSYLFLKYNWFTSFIWGPDEPCSTITGLWIRRLGKFKTPFVNWTKYIISYFSVVVDNDKKGTLSRQIKRVLSIRCTTRCHFLTVCLFVYSMLADDLKLSSDEDEAQRVGDLSASFAASRKTDLYPLKCFVDNIPMMLLVSLLVVQLNTP